MSRLGQVDLSQSLSKQRELKALERAWPRLLQLRLALAGVTGEKRPGPPLLVIFEGWDASGKGGAIKRLVSPLDPRHVSVHQFSSPTEKEKHHHFLWRFFPHLPGWGGMAIYDRSWYGRVLVERVEGYATREEWSRAYEQIAAIERLLAAEGAIVVKFWLHLSSAEQLRRFRKREKDPLKSWKLTEEDWRNRDKHKAYKKAVEEMLERTDLPEAPWTLVAADSKSFARVAVVETVIERIERGLRESGLEVPAPLGDD